MSDLFHARVPVNFIGGVWDVMAKTPQHTYQILTKRPERARKILGEVGRSRLDVAQRGHDLVRPASGGRCRMSTLARQSNWTATATAPANCTAPRPPSGSCRWSRFSVRSHRWTCPASTG